MRALFLVCLLAGCERACNEPPPDAPETPAVTVALERYFPIHRGDRWRYRAGDAYVASGVAGIDAQGVAAIVDDARTPVAHVRASAARIELVSPAGESLTVLLAAPLERGRTWSYAPDASLRCEAKVLRTDVALTVAGVSLATCVEVESRCALEGTPSHVLTETYCPDVGRVRTRFRLAAEQTERTSELVSFLVRGAPLPPRTDDLCKDVIVLPSDIAAACPTFVADTPFAELTRDACVFRAREAGGALRITVAKATAPALVAQDAGTAGGGAYRIEHVDSGVRFTIDGAVCEESSAARLMPLLRSLVAR